MPHGELTGFDLAHRDRVLFVKTSGASRETVQPLYLKQPKEIAERWFLDEIYVAEVKSKIFDRHEYCLRRKILIERPLWKRDPNRGRGWRWNYWKRCTNNQIWQLLIRQVIVVGKSGPGDKFWSDAIAFDVRVQRILRKTGIKLPKGLEKNTRLYDEIEVLDKICEPLDIAGVELDRMLYVNYDKIMEMEFGIQLRWPRWLSTNSLKRLFFWGAFEIEPL